MTSQELAKLSSVRALVAEFRCTLDRRYLDGAAKLMGELCRDATSWASRRELMEISDDLDLSGLSSFVVSRWS